MSKLKILWKLHRLFRFMKKAVKFVFTGTQAIETVRDVAEGARAGWKEDPPATPPTTKQVAARLVQHFKQALNLLKQTYRSQHTPVPAPESSSMTEPEIDDQEEDQEEDDYQLNIFQLFPGGLET